MRLLRRNCFLCLLSLLALAAHAQPDVASDIIYSTKDTLNKPADTVALYTIKKIFVEGNKHTKQSIVLRELSFKEGEQYPLNVIVEKFGESKKQLLSSELFHEVVIALKSFQGHDVYVQVNVKERWYIFPLPFFKLADRNFAEWREKGMSLDRVNYGVDISHKNLTGRNDKLNIYLMTGFTRQVQLSYRGLFLDSAMKWSSGFSVAFGKTREISYDNINTKLIAYKNDDDYVYRFFRANVELTYRPALKTRHSFSVSYNEMSVADTIYKLNPKFFNSNSTLKFPEFNYKLSYVDVDYYPYPRSGYVAEVNFNQKGFSKQFNLSQLTLKGSQYFPINDKWFFNLRLLGHVKIPFEQPFIMRRFLPGEGYMQGFEEAIIDGVAGGYAKGIFTREIFNWAYSIPSKKIDRLNHIPVRIYAKVYGNTGYAYDNQPTIGGVSNKLLFTGGVGLDIVVFYDWIIKLEYSFNSLGQNGLYLHRRDYY